MKLIEAIARLKQHLLKANAPFEAQPYNILNALDVAYRANGNILRIVILNKALEPLIFEAPMVNISSLELRESIMETTFNTADQMSTNWQTCTMYLKPLPEDSVVVQLYNEGMLYKQPEAAT